MTSAAARGTPARTGGAALLSARPAAALIWGVAAASLAAYGALLAWPMRIWHRPVSADTHLVGTLGISLGGAITYVFSICLLFALYGVALWLVLTRRVRPSPAFILAASAGFCLLLLFTHPLTSTDVFNYIVAARVYWVYGDNPLTTPALAHNGDPLYSLLSNWQHLASPYGPLWSLLAGVPARLGGESAVRAVLAFKGMSVLAFLGASWLVYLTARRMRPDSAVPALLVLSWNPLAVFHVAGNGHNDAVMVLFVALALYLLVRGWLAAAIVALAAAALIKVAALLLVPLLAAWWLRSRTRPPLGQVLLGAAGALALTVGAYAPFWEGRETFRTMLDEGSYFTVSTPAALRGALLELGVANATGLTTWLVRVGFLAALALVLVRLRGARLAPLVEAGWLAYFAYLCVAATYFAPWYVLWLLPLAALLPYRRDVLWPALTLSLTAMSVLVWAVWFRERFAPDPRLDWWPVHLVSAVAVFVPPLLVWVWAVRFPPGTPVRRKALRRGGA